MKKRHLAEKNDFKIMTDAKIWLPAMAGSTLGAFFDTASTHPLTIRPRQLAP